jgi:2-keto-4-pentenoate hydratase/2-oxohepta-3-ene-1,7-dioic acid hydratase in catechol pathway
VRIIRFTDWHESRPRHGVLDGEDVLALDGGFDAPAAGRRITSLADVTLVNPCTPQVIVCAGSNYASQLAELGRPRPSQPSMFLKGLNTLAGPSDAIAYPPGLDRLEYEGEVAVVIGRTARDLRAGDVARHVLGYTCANDVTASDWRADGQWTRAKSLDTFCPMGPWIETGIDDPQAMRLTTRLNGQIVQDCGTDDMIFGVVELLVWITRWITLQAGDVVLTATPAGVGPMRVGDTVDVEVDLIGKLSNTVRERDALSA